MKNERMRGVMPRHGALHDALSWRLLPAAINAAGGIEIDAMRLGRTLRRGPYPFIFAGAVMAGLATAIMASRRRAALSWR